jgi:hypothetical protein
VFTFTCDPKEYKKELNKIAKEAAELDQNDPKAKETAAKKPVPKDIITLSQVAKATKTRDEFDRMINVLVKNYNNQDNNTNVSVVFEATSRNSFWSG